MALIQCPGCQNTIPDTFPQCQFCGRALTPTARPKNAPATADDYVPYRAPRWVVPAYYTVSGYFLISGVLSLLIGLGVFGAKGASLISVIAGGITAVVGIGLLAKIDLVRGIANVFSWIKIANGVLSLWSGVLMTGFMPGLGLLVIGVSLLDICTAAALIFLIGETD